VSPKRVTVHLRSRFENNVTLYNCVPYSSISMSKTVATKTDETMEINWKLSKLSHGLSQGAAYRVQLYWLGLVVAAFTHTGLWMLRYL
jgi:hypothetical protein